jgi:hypothetical protein
MREMPTQRGQSKAEPPRASNPIKENLIVSGKIAGRFQNKNRIAINPEKFSIAIVIAISK